MTLPLDPPTQLFALSNTNGDEATAGPAKPRKRGRPLEMAPELVLQRIRDIGSGPGLYRVHLEHPALYARARRLFGSWSAAVLAAGIDYRQSVDAARKRSVATRRELRSDRRSGGQTPGGERNAL